jgi:hypothetical protein
MAQLLFASGCNKHFYPEDKGSSIFRTLEIYTKVHGMIPQKIPLLLWN